MHLALCAFSLPLHDAPLPSTVTEAAKGSNLQSCLTLQLPLCRCSGVQGVCEPVYISAKLSGRNSNSEARNSEERMRTLLVQYCGEWIIIARLESHNTGDLRHVFVILKHLSFYSGPDTGLS